MIKLYRYAKVQNMKLKKYYLALNTEDRQRFVNSVGTSVGYMNLLLCGARKPSPKLSRRLVAASGGELTLEDLRPDVYGPIGPDVLPSVGVS